MSEEEKKEPEVIVVGWRGAVASFMIGMLAMLIIVVVFGVVIFMPYEEGQAVANFKTEVRDIVDHYQLGFNASSDLWDDTEPYNLFPVHSSNWEGVTLIDKSVILIGISERALNSSHLPFLYLDFNTGYYYDQKIIEFSYNYDSGLGLVFSLNTKLLARIHDIPLPMSWLD